MRIISGVPGQLSSDLFIKVARYRHQVFINQLGWPLHTPCQGMELDQFDRLDTMYVVAQDEDADQILGCVRLLPTTRPYLLEEIFPELLNGLPPPSSPDVWELSRFAAVDTNKPTMVSGQFSSPIAINLLENAMACAADHGAKRLISVSPLGVERLLRRVGFHVHRAGPPKTIDGHSIFACWIELSA